MAVNHKNFGCQWTTDAAPAGQPASTLSVYPLRL
jgi:hypothetical protein